MNPAVLLSCLLPAVSLQAADRILIGPDAAALKDGSGVEKVDEDALSLKYRQAQEKYNQAKREHESCLRKAENASSSYEKQKAMTQAKAAEDEMLMSKKEVDALRMKLHPDEFPEGEEPQQEFEVPAVGPAGPLDPRVHQHSWVGTPSRSAGNVDLNKLVAPPSVPHLESAGRGAPGGVSYGQPSGGRPPGGSGSAAPYRRKTREGPAERDFGYGPPASRGEAPDREGPWGEEGGPLVGESGPDVNVGTDFVGREPGRGFVPFRTKGESGESALLRLLRAVRTALRDKDYEEAWKDADELAALAPRDARVRHLRAMVLNRMGRCEEAAAEARAALELGLRDASVYESLAWAELQLGRYEEALRSATRAIELDPGTSLAYAIRAFAYEQLGERGRMISDIRKAAAGNPKKFSSIAKKAASGARIFDPKRDMRHLLDAEPEKPAPPFALWLLAALGASFVMGAVLWAWSGRRKR